MQQAEGAEEETAVGQARGEVGASDRREREQRTLCWRLLCGRDALHRRSHHLLHRSGGGLVLRKRQRLCEL